MSDIGQMMAAYIGGLIITVALIALGVGAAIGAVFMWWLT